MSIILNYLILSVHIYIYSDSYTTQKNPTIHQVTTMLATSKNVLFPGHNHPANHWYWSQPLGDSQSVESSIRKVNGVAMSWK